MDIVCTGPTPSSSLKSIACPASWYAVIDFSFSLTILDFFSVPIPTFINALFISSADINLFPSLAESIAASFIRFSRSAPVNPEVCLATECKSTSSPKGFDATCIFNIASLAATSGLPTATFLSNLPGLKSAGSRISTLLVAAITIIP